MTQREEYRILASPHGLYRVVSKEEFEENAKEGARLWVVTDWSSSKVKPHRMVQAYISPPASWNNK